MGLKELHLSYVMYTYIYMYIYLDLYLSLYIIYLYFECFFSLSCVVPNYFLVNFL